MDECTSPDSQQTDPAIDGTPHPSRPDLRNLSERARALDRELRRLARRDAEGRRVLGLLAHRFIELRGYERVGFARLSDYAAERLGCSARQLEESARVAHGLNALPQTEAAFLDGRIGWSKVRLLVSLATVDDEARWLEVADNVDVRSLSSLTRNARSAAREQRIVGDIHPSASTDAAHDDDEEEERRVLLRIECNRRTRLMWNDACRCASRMAGKILAAWQVAELVAAEASTTPGPYAAVWEEEPWKSLSDIHAESRREAAFSRERAVSTRAEGPALFAADDSERDGSFIRDLDGLSDKNAYELDAAMRRVQHEMQQTDCRLGRALGMFVELRLHEELGHRSAASYAVERLGMSERSARELVRVTRAADRTAGLADAYADGRLSSMQVRTLLAVLTPINAAAWIARAAEVTLRRLTDEVAWALDRRDRFLDVACMPPQRDAPLGLDRTLAPSSRTHGRQMCADGGAASGMDGMAGEAGGRQMCADGDAASAMDGTAATAGAAGERQMCADGDAASDMEQTAVTAGEAGERQMYAAGGELFGIIGRIHVTFLAPASVATVFRTVLQGFAAPHEGRWLAFERMLEQVLAHWTAQPRHRDPVFARDGFRCTAPGCSSQQNLHDHHIIPRSAGGSNDMENRTTLCAWHHLHGVHGGRARATGNAPDELHWELGIDGRDSALMELRGERYVEQRDRRSASR